MQSPIIIRSKLPNTGISIFARMTALANQHGAINLAQGFPDFPPPKRLVSLVADAMRKGHNQYAPMPGVPDLREAIADKTKDTYKCKVDAEKEVTVTAGATYGLFAAFQALLHEGDEVLVFEPAYDSYVPGIQLAGAEPVFVELHAPDYSIDWEGVKKKINARTRAILINTPHNPSGTCWTKNDLLQLEKIVVGTDIIVISDEVYEHITFDDGRHESVLRYPKLAQQSIVISSFGKTYHNTGWKMGYVIANESITKEFRAVHQFLVFSVNTPMQYAVAQFIREAPEHFQDLPQFYQRKRDFFLEAVKDSRFSFTPASGTYFQLLDYSAISDEQDTVFAERITAEFGVAAIPLSPFYRGPVGDRVLRFCFAKSEKTLEKAAAILCRI
ncbi:MAG: aminotransferase class I/II-fold pyridoxal phosphate-dependent enzyme [Chitinophagales bacterium]|nr:aminotransferase class I/II-fold pyridoxal phosphate-dependent enzyme [Chitinophagales bacterium]MCB9019643.1 aminotransferase class I/II-fold pyridoxal phosphate-dependent enzyme [Chitinophagales bacterium]MCB9021133.1 aminotransferase class I/II-fold pyridoxal phosphate-dependent enzyme [Chitinophagales bacterium]HPE96508.1 methionine aminotransferase [Chitinophagales bacterium]HPR28803.1 methionine aminotransferase [Chitinophagales bacterium]